MASNNHAQYQFENQSPQGLNQSAAPQLPTPPGSMGYQQAGSSYNNPASPYGDSADERHPQIQGQAPLINQARNAGNMADITSQMSNMGLGIDGPGIPHSRKKKDRHAYHNLDSQANNPSMAGMPMAGAPMVPGAAQFNQPGPLSPGYGLQFGQQPAHGASQSPAPVNSMGTPFNTAMQQSLHTQTKPQLSGTPASSSQGRVDPEQIPSIPWSRDAPSKYYLENIYPTMEQHLPPPSAIPFVAFDQGNASPKFARLTVNNIPATSDALATTGLPLGLILQPLAKIQDGENPIPVLDFGESGPPRCRRCRAYINPFMTFRSGGNKYVCNMCTYPNDVAPEYFSPTDPSGIRVDRAQRPELTLGTVEFIVPKEYWGKEPVPLRWMFLIDVSSEAITRGFLHGVCTGILNALYDSTEVTLEEDEGSDGKRKGSLPAGSQVGIATFDREVHFYNLNPGLNQPQMVVMPDMDDPFVPHNDGLFVDPEESKTLIKALLTQLPTLFARTKNPEPCLAPTLNAALSALSATGGKIICSLASLPTWGPGRLFLREKPEYRGNEAEKKMFSTEHPVFTEIGNKMVANGIGVDFFLAAPQGGYLDIATIGHVSGVTGGEVYFYPNFHAPRDVLRLSKEIKHAVRRETGFQALMKVRCSTGLQVSAYHGNFLHHIFGADLELGVIDSDKAFGVSFTYDGKLDPKLDAHFQSALLYTTATGERRVRCSNMVACVSESAMESMKFVDQDAVITLITKQAVSKMGDRSLKEIRASVTENTIDILAAYRKNFSGSHPPGQLVLPENLKEFSMYMLGLIKSRAIKGGLDPSDRRVHDMRLLKSMGAPELSLYLYPRIIAIHNLSEQDGFANEAGHLRMPSTIRASYSKIEEGGAYIVDSGQICLLWLHAQVSPNLLEDLFGEGKNNLQDLDPLCSELPVLETHLSAQVRNILQYLETYRGSKALTIQLARQGLDGAEYEFARLLLEDRNNEAQSYVDWLVHVHRHIQLELAGQRKKEESRENSVVSNLTGLKAPYW